MIDTTTETLLSLPEALRLLPPGRRNKRPHLSTLLRWILHGVDGVRLEAIRLGSRWITSREAVQRFAERLTPEVGGDAAQTPRPLTARQRASDRAANELSKVGI